MTKPDVYYDTIVIGGGQAGLAMGYHLKQQGRDFIILDGNQRVGDSWRNRWDSLRLFTPARYDGLPGMAFPAPGHSYPTKDEMADFLEAYAKHFDLPVQTGVWVQQLSKRGKQFILTTNERQYQANNVVVAMANWQKPRLPEFAETLDSSIVQMHSSEYHSPDQLQDGGVLVVGAGNSGVEIALDAVRDHPTWLSGTYPGQIPFNVESLIARLILVRLVVGLFFHRIATLNTPVGRKMRSKTRASAMPLVRTKPKHVAAAGVEHVPRTVGVRDGLPVLEDGRSLDVTNIIWSTGFHPGFSSWIDLPILNDAGLPNNERGVVSSQPGLYFIGLLFIYAASSAMVQGVGRDAAYIAGQIAKRSGVTSAESASLSPRETQVA